MAGAAQELRHAWLGKDVVEALLRHMGGFERKEMIQQAINVASGRGMYVPIAGQPLQFADLAAQAASHCGTQDVLEERFAAPVNGQLRNLIDWRFVRE